MFLSDRTAFGSFSPGVSIKFIFPFKSFGDSISIVVLKGFFPLTFRKVHNIIIILMHESSELTTLCHFMKNLFRECVRDFGKPIPIIFEGS